MPNKLGNYNVDKNGQAILELTLVIAVLVLFMMGAVQIMCWFGNSLGERAQHYSTTRSALIDIPGLGASPELGYEPPALHLFKD